MKPLQPSTIQRLKKYSTAILTAASKEGIRLGKEGEMPHNIWAGLCYQLECWRHFPIDVLTAEFPRFAPYTGDWRFPVPCDTGCPVAAYVNTFDLWEEGTEYTANRRAFCRFIARIIRLEITRRRARR